MIVANKYEFPDKCPKDCKFTDDVRQYGQNSICIRCPVFNCSMPENPTEEDKIHLPLLRPEDYRPDWAKEWRKFFDGETDFPHLSFDLVKNDE